MKGTKVALRFAKALLELAIDQKCLDSVAGDMRFLDETVKGSRELQMLLKNPVVKADKKIAIFEAVFEHFEGVSLSFIRLITKKGREQYLHEIAVSFDTQVKEYLGIVPVTLTSATPLDASTKEMILNKVKVGIEGTLEIEEKINPDLIGGFIIRMGDRQIDASVEHQLNLLKQQLTRS